MYIAHEASTIYRCSLSIAFCCHNTRPVRIRTRLPQKVANVKEDLINIMRQPFPSPAAKSTT
ncbi:uncharacterized protein L969DRAFT_53612 [Mixia osmundae IAM 14324]|uniref:Uncharacterized protein n=1 Tax=Mixia osmundae (strain CBS 9802 / IAM 14324 / JCM 22182 / KY 12970) TaxID=764103 RepID=G7EAX7_MIXOS|nr:uncharacterized protein L969DRAFT_53612 [Mixia osmundae IAM 14324]KEI37022.1 hypothetical protein L969DRAFT_53612 [Mixia osmundae IAM 14324]GAA99987.1 hypothetical protein E5Q_06690 [Mixia osmundae IAM 14324]